MNKKITILSLILLIGFSQLPVAYAENITHENNICQPKGTVFGFFNGVQTTSYQAHINLNHMKQLYGNTTAKGEAITYELLYNRTNGFEDFVEVFEQRLIEQNSILNRRYELFFEAIREGNGFLDKIKKAIPAVANLISAFNDSLQASTLRALTSITGQTHTTQDYKEHQARIDTWALEGYKMLFVAHSQGNLFANSAYNYVRTKTDTEAVQVVHIAPASPIVNGNHVLADKDLVINALRLAGSVPPITDFIPVSRPAGLNSKKDFLGHGLLEIYLNPHLTTSARISDYIHTSFNTLKRPEAKASSGLFTITLTWDGSGDIDLHTFEPNMQVFYRSPQGKTGYLDVDNTQGFGPEHYFASCDKTKIQEGNYTIKLANYGRADGRTATVQIASNQQGVLLTKTATMGERTRDNPTHFIANINVSKNSMGNYIVKVE